MKPNELRFTKSHEWVSPDGTVGISDHAQHEITDVVFVELPKPGRTLKAAEGCCAVESVKAAFDIYSPIAGDVTAINEALSKDPALVNKSPYESGWLFKIKPSNPDESKQLMTHEQYQEFLKKGSNE